MTVIVNIWLGELPQFTVWNAIYGLNVGHGSMLVINDENPKDKIYISHRPQITYSGNSKAKFNNKDTSKQYALGDSFTPKAEWISFDEDCDKRGRKPDSQIKILGLHEYRIREFYKWYFNNDLPEYESQYHVRKNNCCAVVAYFIRKGLKCPEQECCNFCSAEENTPEFFNVASGSIIDETMQVTNINMARIINFLVTINFGQPELLKILLKK
ncbi:hypothetical protein [Okeania sp. KiyG1]|uniref:hypothetical protein n=1 Tax=Okeania sp. KiyG1 TaxID=2720165 RepID=UPI001924A8F0|nr:hypothetical protein [Okeania sp. KiyG1]GGA11107.1 hypothetical protein CYANOKiyG1_24050 [Okeania sp. KiyG1]